MSYRFFSFISFHSLILFHFGLTDPRPYKTSLKHLVTECAPFTLWGWFKVFFSAVAKPLRLAEMLHDDWISSCKVFIFIQHKAVQLAARSLQLLDYQCTGFHWSGLRIQWIQWIPQLAKLAVFAKQLTLNSSVFICECVDDLCCCL